VRFFRAPLQFLPLQVPFASDDLQRRLHSLIPERDADKDDIKHKRQSLQMHPDVGSEVKALSRQPIKHGLRDRRKRTKYRIRTSVKTYDAIGERGMKWDAAELFSMDPQELSAQLCDVFGMGSKQDFFAILFHCGGFASSLLRVSVTDERPWDNALVCNLGLLLWDVSTFYCSSS
jgi:hypothetical protein